MAEPGVDAGDESSVQRRVYAVHGGNDRLGAEKIQTVIAFSELVLAFQRSESEQSGSLVFARNPHADPVDVL